jgi:hypothetical protein
LTAFPGWAQMAATSVSAATAQAAGQSTDPRGRELQTTQPPKAQPPRKRSGKRAAEVTKTLESAGRMILPPKE